MPDFPVELTNDVCPWHQLREVSGLPNVKWCEQTLCTWVMEPANTWSNVAFLIAAAYLFFVVRGSKDQLERFWPTATFWVGLTSLVYHMTLSFLTQVFDFFGMYCFFVFIVLMNAMRLGWLAREKVIRWTWVLVAGFTLFTVVVAKLHLPVQGIIVLLLIASIATEVLASNRATVPVSRKYFYLALLLIGVAAAFSASDVTRRWCDPTNHWIQGHAIWHVLDAIGITVLFFHYRQFTARPVERAG